MTSIGSSYGTSAWSSLQAWHTRMKAISEQASADASALSGTLSGALTDQSQGLANLVAQESLDRLNAAVAAKQSASRATAPAADPVASISIQMDEIINGTDSLVASVQSQSAPGAAAGDPVEFAASIDRIADGSSDLIDPTATAADGTNFSASIDSIIDGFSPPVVPILDVTA